ncbi:unnamed protein product [Prunus armeniaca]
MLLSYWLRMPGMAVTKVRGYWVAEMGCGKGNRDGMGGWMRKSSEVKFDWVLVRKSVRPTHQILGVTIWTWAVTILRRVLPSLVVHCLMILWELLRLV